MGRHCQSMMSVCPSVRPSGVTLTNCDDISLATWNFITRLLTAVSRRFAYTISASYSPRGTSSVLGLNIGGVRKIGYFHQPISRCISETVRDRVWAKVIINY